MFQQFRVTFCDKNFVRIEVDWSIRLDLKFFVKSGSLKWSNHLPFSSLYKNMAPENSQNSNIQLNSMEIDKLENAFKNPEFRQLLVEYSKEINDPENRRRYEAEFKQYESEKSGVECTFLHPQPGYVIKTWGSVNNRNQEKVFINICSDENVAKPASQKAVSPTGGKKGVQWSIPYSLTKARKDIDKAGLSCMVYDVIFHPNALALAEKSLAMRGLLNDTALEAVEKCGDQVLTLSQIKL